MAIEINCNNVPASFDHVLTNDAAGTILQPDKDHRNVMPAPAASVALNNQPPEVYDTRYELVS